LLACVLVLLPACADTALEPGSPEAVNSTEAADPAATEFPWPLEMQPHTTAIPEVTQEGDPGEEGNGINAPVGSSIAQIVDFYNQYANMVKKAKKIGITKHDFRDGDIHVPAIIKRFVPYGIDALDPSVDRTIAETFVDGKGTKSAARNLNDFLPVNGTSSVSMLKPSHVRAANCTAQEDGWLVQIVLKNEPLDLDTMRKNAGGIGNISEIDKDTLINDILLTSGYGSTMDMAFSEWLLSQNNEGFDLGTIKAKGTLEDGRIIARVNGEGRLTSLNLSFVSNINVSYLGIKIKISITSKQEYKFVWYDE